MTPTGFDVHLTFLSDWHVGTGAGRVGAIDACVHRDHDHLPFVPAKTLTGVWRDACETVAHVLDGGPQGSWSTWVTTLFGAHENDRHSPAMLAIGPARLPDDVAAALHAHQALREALFARRPGLAIDPATGTAREHFLRLEERAATGLTLTARVEALRLRPGVPLPDEAEFLLRAGARLVDALGGKRSRGAGRVLLHVGPPPSAAQGQDHPDPRLLQLLDQQAMLNSPGKPPTLYQPTTDLAWGRTDQRRQIAHRITLRVRTPVVVPDRLRGNLLTTHDRILGTGLLPAILERIPERLDLNDIRVTDAVPAFLVNGRYVPAHPAPLVWHRPDKGEGPVMLNIARRAASPSKKAKPTRDRIVRLDDGRWTTLRPGITDRTHAVIDDEKRRPVESAGGGLFTFEGIPAGTTLVTDVVLPDGVDPGLATRDRLRLGRSRKDDFGQVEVLSVEVMPEPAPGPDTASGGVLTVWCLSDVLLRSPSLAPDPTPEGLAAALGAALGTTLAVVRAPEGDDRRPTLAAAARREGFAVRWGRPRPSQVALAAGSVVTLAVTGPPVSAQALARVEHQGVGARLAEGFGQVRFNLPDLDQPYLHLVTDPPPGDDNARENASAAIPAMLHGVLHAAWRTVIRRKVEELAAGRDLLDLLLPEAPPPWTGPRTSRPTASQLGQLRAQLERDPEQVRAWFAGLRASTNRSRSWSDHAIDAAECLLLGQVPQQRRKVAAKVAGVWEHLGLQTPQELRAAGLPPESDDLHRELVAEARTHLLVAMHRQLRVSPAPTPEATR
jgi:CRISPR-associated protein Csx10